MYPGILHLFPHHNTVLLDSNNLNVYVLRHVASFLYLLEDIPWSTRKLRWPMLGRSILTKFEIRIFCRMLTVINLRINRQKLYRIHHLQNPKHHPRSPGNLEKIK
ncbi:hypothetical protein V1477_003875 [Vespula maculifrons]|uniref:Uncharacterized protein n=1 Tax=Vespula maculifrons TaxID=7453 RepID=A0ABD2CSA7_VESMC